MRRTTILWTVFICLSVCGFIGYKLFQPTANLQLTGMAPFAPAGPPCLVQPVAPIEDASALAFENGFGAAVDTENLAKGTARALARFQRIITAKGGTVKVTSAYRPPAYQQHLQAVWDKWMHELRDNHEPLCQQLRSQVAKEFTRHSLLETQRPVNFSDHTRGLAFDAAVTLPAPPRRARGRFSLDKLARLCLLRRPDILHDPVHFKLAVAKRGRSA